MIIHHEQDAAELRERIERNRTRLYQPYYQMPHVFQPKEADWPGDKEGRALLAFVCHYKMTGDINPCMERLLEEMPAHTCADLYFGPPAQHIIHEQQLSGHSWLLRGLCEHYEQFRDEFSLKALVSITQSLYLPTTGRYGGYPVARTPEDLLGGVSGHTVRDYEGWKLSTDIGCAFMSIDGLSHVYRITKDARVKALVDEMIQVYTAIDKVALKAQTHCTLTAARGMLRMYQTTGEPAYLTSAKGIFSLYVYGGGMDPVFQNLNWWGRPDTWTEPCAIVDSLMLAGQLYEITEREVYRRTAARIYVNGLASAQRPHGGAGTDAVVWAGDRASGATVTNQRGKTSPESQDVSAPLCDSLYLLTDEAPFCCTMRLAEGLWYAYTHLDMLYYETEETKSGEMLVVQDRMGSSYRYMCGDLVLVEPTLEGCTDTEEGWSMPAPSVTVDGHSLHPLFKYYALPVKVAEHLHQKVLFPAECE